MTYPAFWSTGNYVGRQVAEHGWRASLRTAEGVVVFRRDRRLNRETGAGAATRGTVESPLGARNPDLVLVGCVKEKRDGRMSARDLYASPLFAGRRRRAEAANCPWFILSAKHGLIDPEEQIEPYDEELAQLPTPARCRWSDAVVRALVDKVGDLRGKRVEIHAGAAYRDFGLVDGLRALGATVDVPLDGLTLGEQLAWYAAHGPTRATPPLTSNPSPGMGATDARDSLSLGDLVAEITEAFTLGQFDLSQRSGAPAAGWDSLPECVAAAKLRSLGCTDAGVRIFLTLVAALDRAREANQLWEAATRLFQQATWVFNPAAVITRSFTSLRDELAAVGVSQRHGPDAAAWRILCETLSGPDAPRAVSKAIRDGEANAALLAEELQATTAAGQPRFPSLAGPKISAMWMRMMAFPGAAKISNLASVPVAVDVQVRKVSEYLGATATDGQPIESVRGTIQAAWAAHASRAVGPGPLAGTSAAIDPVLWFFGNWGVRAVRGPDAGCR